MYILTSTAAKSTFAGMDRDDISDAFARWKVAYDAFQAAEQLLFATLGGRAQTYATNLREEDPQLIEVQAKRADAEHLLLVAMKLLHERRHPGVNI